MSHTGTVKWFNFRKGFGFIEDSETKEDLFVHATGVKGNPLKDNDEVQFELGDDEKTGKKCAIDVTGGSGWPSKGKGKKGKGKGKGRGKPREGDWTCPKEECAENNFAFRDVCHKCGESKPE